MEIYLRKAETVPFESLYLDPNNPRLAIDEPPGYSDPKELFEKDLQKSLHERVERVYEVSDLEQAIIGQGWMPIDNIVVWTYPNVKDRHIVVEGNTRTVALRNIRERLKKEEEKLRRMSEKRSRYAPHDVVEQGQLVERLKRIIKDTDNITVLPLDAKNVEELKRKLPRVLAVRHVTGTKPWGSYAEDLWLLGRYTSLFEHERKGEPLRWDTRLIQQIADEASLNMQKAKRKLKTASCFSHFRKDFEEALPKGQEFKPTDYYLFELIIKKPWLRQQFSLGEDDLHIPPSREQVLFDWVFKLSRGKSTSADDNPNVFYRHENVRLWEEMKRYDDAHGTAFAGRFDVDESDAAPPMREVEVDYLAHKARKKPTDVIEQLLQQLGKLDSDTLLEEGTFIRRQLERLHDKTGRLVRMLKAADAK